jgi:Fe-S oxidoreductase
MSRPDDRPLKKLPSLAPRKATFERCVFCPKLCRSACPVSNAEPRETLTPWGKMSMAYFSANGSVALAETFAAPAWACTGCFGCREHCDHQNDVTGTLLESRSALVDAGVAPEAARRVLDRFGAIAETPRNTERTLSVLPEVKEDAKTAVLVGCPYGAGDEARDAVRSIAKLTDGPVSLVDVCCGAPLLYAGDRKRFVQQGEMLGQALKHAEQVIVVDAGCASTLKVHHAQAGNVFSAPIIHFTELAARELAKIQRVPLEGNVRWHDPCQLGRGLGVYDAPRAVLTRALGAPPSEFERKREDARCSGAGALLPLTMPDVARGIAEQRTADHDRSGGGTIVTACASSARSFRKAGATTIDIATVVARSLGLR